MAGAGLFAGGYLTTVVFGAYGSESFRYGGVAMCAIFLIGIVVLPFLPETKDQPLPE